MTNEALMSDTPRTDAAISDAWMLCGVHVVSADFARQLERANAAMRKVLIPCRHDSDDFELHCAIDEVLYTCQDGKPCKRLMECDMRRKCAVFKGTPMETPPWLGGQK